MLKRAFSLPGNVDLALPHTLYEVVGGQVDQFDGIGAIEYRVRHGFAHPHVRDLGDHVVEAFDVLDIDGGVNVDAVAHQLFDVEITFRVAAAFDVGVSEFVDQNDLRMTSDDGIEVHLLEPLTLIENAPARHDFEARQQRFGFPAAVRLDNADNDVVAVLVARLRLLQHLIGLADARCGADKDAQLTDAPLLAACRFEQSFG